MNEDDRPTPAPPRVSVPEMLDDYRRRREAFETQARELADLQHEVLDAAAREGAGIVADARARIARILADARRDLLNLAKRVEGLRGGDEQAAAVSESLQRARREISRLLHEEKPGIDALGQDAATLGAPVPARDSPRPREALPLPELPPLPEPAPPLLELPPLPEPAPPRDTPTRGVGPDIERPSPFPGWRSDSPFRPPPEPPVRERHRSRRTWAIGIVIASVALIAAMWWWIRRPAPVAQGAPVSTMKSTPSPPTPNRGAPAGSPARSAAASARALRLIVEARRPVWVRKTIDGRADDGRMVGAGERTEIVAAREVSIRAGDAGAVFVSVNGAAAEPLGPDGAVVTRSFAADGQQQRPDRSAPRDGAAGPPAAGTAPTTGRAATPAPPQSLPAPPASRSPQSAPAQPPSAPPATRGSPASSGELTNAAQRWLDAYSRQDTRAMQAVATRDMKVSDQRTPAERLPASAESVRRTLEGITFQFVGETAIMTGRMIEQGNVGGRAPQYISWVSLMWIREGGQWRLMDVQLLSDGQLRQRPGL